MKNESGIYPCGNRVLVRADELKDTTAGGIYLPDEVKNRHQVSACYGYVVAMGPDGYEHVTEKVFHVHDGGREEMVERRAKGYSRAFAKPGDRIAFALYAGLTQTGKDGIEYKIINDEDITCLVDEGVTQTSIEGRKSFKAEGL